MTLEPLVLVYRANKTSINGLWKDALSYLTLSASDTNRKPWENVSLSSLEVTIYYVNTESPLCCPCWVCTSQLPWHTSSPARYPLTSASDGSAVTSETSGSPSDELTRSLCTLMPFSSVSSCECPVVNKTYTLRGHLRHPHLAHHCLLVWYQKEPFEQHCRLPLTMKINLTSKMCYSVLVCVLCVFVFFNLKNKDDVNIYIRKY